MANETDEKTARIKELEDLLKSVEKTHAFQADRADKLEADLKAANEKHNFQKKRADKLEAFSKNAPPAKGIFVLIDGVQYESIGDFRADNTFVEVKRGHCPEGVTLVAINKQH